MSVLAEYLKPPEIVILRGVPAQLSPWKQVLARLCAPHRVILAIPAGTQKLTKILDKRVHDAVNAWVCRGVICLSPIKDLQELFETCQSAQIDR